MEYLVSNSQLLNAEVISIKSGIFSSIINSGFILALVSIWGIGLQIRNKNITEERQKWLTSLKSDVSKFMAILEKNNPEIEKDFDSLYYKIYFNLNENDKLIDNKIINELDKVKETKETKGTKKILKNRFSKMFKFEWERIKVETGWRTYIPFIGSWLIKDKVKELKNIFK